MENISSKNNKYDAFIDWAKILACFAVVIGHLFQSLILAGICKETTGITVLIKIIYLFHVQLFFVCSGYLYQKRTIITTIADWNNHILKKFINLGIPYIFFSAITWMLKKIMADAVNLPIREGLIETILIRPISPYWFLISLLFMFILPPVRNKVWLLLYCGIGMIMSGLVFGTNMNINWGIISNTMTYYCYFVLGMMLAYNINSINRIRHKVLISSVVIIVWIITGIYYVMYSQCTWICNMILGMIICICILLFFSGINYGNDEKNMIRKLSKYTFPIYLLHTLSAASTRIILLKLGINTQIIHILAGIIMSTLGPVLIYDIYIKIKKKFKINDFLRRIMYENEPG